MTGVDDMSTQDVFGYFKEYPPAHIEWIDDASCESLTPTRTSLTSSGLLQQQQQQVQTQNRDDM